MQHSQKFAVLTALSALSVAAAGSIPRGVGPECMPARCKQKVYFYDADKF